METGRYDLDQTDGGEQECLVDTVTSTRRRRSPCWSLSLPPCWRSRRCPARVHKPMASRATSTRPTCGRSFRPRRSARPRYAQPLTVRTPNTRTIPQACGGPVRAISAHYTTLRVGTRDQRGPQGADGPGQRERGVPQSLAGRLPHVRIGLCLLPAGDRAGRRRGADCRRIIRPGGGRHRLHI